MENETLETLDRAETNVHRGFLTLFHIPVSGKNKNKNDPLIFLFIHIIEPLYQPVWYLFYCKSFRQSPSYLALDQTNEGGTDTAVGIKAEGQDPVLKRI